MTMSAAQSAAFFNTTGFKPDETNTLFVGFVLTISLLWGAWAILTAYRGWATRKLDGDKLVGVIGRFFLIYLVLGYLVLKN